MRKTDGADITDYTYSSTGELLDVTLPDNTLIEYIHDPLGRRIAKMVNGVVVKKYLWQGMLWLLAVYDGNDNLLVRFEYADDRMPYAMTAGGITYYLAYDHIGSLRLVTDAAGNIIKRIDYDSYGNVIADSNPSLSMPFGFAGGLHDRDTNLVRFGYRDYSPEIGRWTAKDPILFAAGDANLYGYVQNNPVNFVDPLGLWAFWAGSSNVAAVGRGINFGGGFAIDSEKGLGYYGTAGRMVGLGASTGVEAGFFSGSISGETTTFTFGLKFWSVGLIASQDGWGVVFGATLPKASIPFELTVAKNITTFTALEDNQASKQNCSGTF